MSRIAIILVHKGESHPESKAVLDTVTVAGLNGLTKILANENTQQWLRHNAKGVVVKEYPSFLVCQEGRSTQIYSASDADVILDMLRHVTNG